MTAHTMPGSQLEDGSLSGKTPFSSRAQFRMGSIDEWVPCAVPVPHHSLWLLGVLLGAPSRLKWIWALSIATR